MAVRVVIGQPAHRQASPQVEAERRAAAAAWRQWALAALAWQVRDGSEDDGAFEEHGHGWRDGRYTAFVVPRLVAVRLWDDRIDVDHKQVEDAARRAMAFVLRRQLDDGRLDLGGAYSPNEAGFPIPALVEAHRRLGERRGGWADELRESIEVYVTRAAEAVLAGEAATANHRWAAAAGPLAAAHSLKPDPRYLEKIKQYLADGIDCDADGCWFEERGVGYNNVANHGMLVLADHLGRPDLLDHVVRNLRFMLHQVQPSGEADTSYSFRQDRGRPGHKPCNYAIGRRAAIVSGDGRLTSLAQVDGVHGPGAAELMPLLFELDNHPGPPPEPEPIPTDYETLYENIQVLRCRRGDTALTLAADRGEHFFDSVRDQWGGPRRSEDWLQLHHGTLVIQSLQLAVAGMRPIQPQRLRRSSEGDYELAGHDRGWTHTAHFRPHKPEIHMPWDLEHRARVRWVGDEIAVDLCCRTPHALAASLRLWVRAGATLHVPGGRSRPIEAGHTIALDGPGPVCLQSGENRLVIQGVPAPAHRMPIESEPSIPTATPSVCGCLTLGLRLPVDLRLRMKLGA